MTSLKDKLLETIIKDFESLKENKHHKTLRKECSLLLKRIESARKLFSQDKALHLKINGIENEIKLLKNK